MAFSSSSKSVKSEINVTPLVDVVLVLLIIFMVITPLLQHGKPVELPFAESASDGKKDPIFLSITADGGLWVEKTQVPLAALRDTLATAATERPGAPLVLKGERDLDYKIVRQVLAELAKGNLPGVSLAVNHIPQNGAR
jgi:biopolymer transport protein TolR